ncbi:unnamed protein product [Pedinophyceae sp. YPF-701]|nr:unnamed protein product [Pedinophyceae sp. YPF-701]
MRTRYQGHRPTQSDSKQDRITNSQDTAMPTGHVESSRGTAAGGRASAGGAPVHRNAGRHAASVRSDGMPPPRLLHSEADSPKGAVRGANGHHADHAGNGHALHATWAGTAVRVDAAPARGPRGDAGHARHAPAAPRPQPPSNASSQQRAVDHLYAAEDELTEGGAAVDGPAVTGVTGATARTEDSAESEGGRASASPVRSGKRERRPTKRKVGAPLRMIKQKWTEEEVAALRYGVEKYGVGKWRLVQNDAELGPILAHRSNVDLKDKWRNLTAAPHPHKRKRGAGESWSHPHGDAGHDMDAALGGRSPPDPSHSGMPAGSGRDGAAHSGPRGGQRGRRRTAAARVRGAGTTAGRPASRRAT